MCQCISVWLHIWEACLQLIHAPSAQDWDRLISQHHLPSRALPTSVAERPDRANGKWHGSKLACPWQQDPAQLMLAWPSTAGSKPQGASLCMDQEPPPSLLYSRRSCSLEGRPCQNSMMLGLTR